MAAIKQTATIYVLLSALLVAVYRMTVPAWPEGLDEDLGNILHWIMAAGILLIFLGALKWRTGPAKSAGATFHGAIALPILFFWVWGCSTWSDSEIAHIAHAVWWPAVDTLYVVLGLSAGLKMLRD